MGFRPKAEHKPAAKFVKRAKQMLDMFSARPILSGEGAVALGFKGILKWQEAKAAVVITAVRSAVGS